MIEKTRPDHECPNCEGTEFELAITQLVDVRFYEDGDHDVTDGPRGDLEWGDETQAVCRECGWAGILGEAKPT